MHTRAPHTASPAVELTGEGRLKLEQAAHIGSLSCPITLSPTPRHLHQPHCQQPGWCHTYPTLAPDVTHATPCSLWRKTGGHMPFLDGGQCQGDIATALSAGCGLTLPLPYSVAQKEGGSGPAPTGWEPWPPPKLRKERIGSSSSTLGSGRYLDLPEPKAPGGVVGVWPGSWSPCLPLL